MELQEIITEKIKSKKNISFEEFMNLALYHHKFGYYRSNVAKFGKNGDFITAPETSDLFGFCLAKQIIELNTSSDSILEFGAGSGIMASQILFYLAQNNQLPKKYYILELSGVLQQQQRDTIYATLPELQNIVEWIDKLPKEFNGIMLGNEVLDAMPAKRAIIQNNYFYELGVALSSDDNFIWQPTNIKLSNKKYDLKDGYISEFNLQNLLWIKTLSTIQGKWNCLLIDYGMSEREFFHIDRNMGTLRCYQNHQADDNPFVNIGKKDITTWVNFSNIATEVQKNNLHLLGYCTQAMFLISLGIEEFLLQENDENKKIQLANEIKQLVFPNAMGESFKVLAFNNTKPLKLTGFNEQNMDYKL